MMAPAKGWQAGVALVLVLAAAALVATGVRASAQSQPSTVALSPVASVAKVTDISHAGDERLFIVEQPGRIRIYQPGTGLLTTPFLDISGPVDDSGNEMGLLGLAFHPNYASNGYFYVNYTHSLSGTRTTRVSRFTRSGTDANIANPASEVVILEFGQPYINHNGGALHFGPDGYLVIASGDGGDANDPQDYSQNRRSLLGKLLRVDVDMLAGGLPDCSTFGSSNYRIPADNPLADGVGGAACDEIWDLGLRNPWRFAFDRQTGDLWMADVGQFFWEEIDFEPSGSGGGRNYGWDCYEGNATNSQDPSPDCTGDPADYTFPVHVYSHSNGNCSITGGYVYRGPSYGGLDGHYLFADYCTGRLWTLSGDPASPAVTTLALAAGSSLSSPRTFGEDAAGELYVASDTAVYRIVDPEPGPAVPVVTIAVGAGSSVMLNWPDDPAACSYEVYEATAPYGPATAGSLLGVVSQGEPTTFNVDGAVGDPALNRYYTVRSVNCSGLRVADSAQAGEFDYALTAGLARGP